MTQFVAILGGQNSGLTTRDKAIEWASKQLASNHNHSQIFICEAVAVVERTSQPISVRDIERPPVLDIAEAA